MDIASESGAATRVRTSSTLLALGILTLGFLASLYVLFGSPQRVRAAGQTLSSAGEVSSGPTVAQIQPPLAAPAPQAATSPAPAAQTPRILRRHLEPSPDPASATVPPQISTHPSPSLQTQTDQAQMELDASLEELRQSRQNLAQASDVQRRTLIACAIFLAVFAIIAVAVVIQVYAHARNWSKRSLESVNQVEAIAAQLTPLRDAQGEVRRALPRLLQDVGEQPLSFQEEGVRFPPQTLTVLDDIDHLAYLGDARLAFSSFSQPSQAAVYLNGLLLSAVAHLARHDPWTAIARLNQFLDLLNRYPDAVDHHRIAQAYSYRAQAAYQALETQDAEPSWLRKSERSQIEMLSKQAFADVAQASRLDPDWKHTTFVEAELCSRFYFPDEPGDSGSRAELFVRGLRRAVSLYRGLIDEKCYRGPARHSLAHCLKRIAEQTGDKSDFSDFGYALSSFPTDEELADEALAARQPASQDRFLWQWMLSDEELFRAVDKLNLAEYRSFWVRLLDNKVHLRNWRADLGELQQRNPAMRDWSVQLLHADAPIPLANAISRRQERFDAPSSGT